ncbi:E3 ubiquitin-protein ligase TRIM13-like isoform X2 [Macrobrachium rosenbergii]|uniref:E3 ubiquitin-protein ligase TRIM13-like isoform X2 n=1 Tax=Macrobrachium rosenbergii TaxID=79674 RepID=UPI0034D51655
MVSHPLECDICCNTYSDHHCPRILPCSHEFCSRCIDGLISTQKKECPTCKQKFTANSAEDLMIIRGLLDAAKQLPSKNEESKITSTRPKRPFLDTTKYFRESVIGKRIAVCEETKVEVNDCIESNKKMSGGLEGLMQTLEGIMLSCQNFQSNIARDNKLLMDKLDILEGKTPQLKDSENKLEAATDFASAVRPMDEADKVLQEVDEAANEIKQLLQENKGNTKQDTLQMKINLENALKVIETMTEEEQQEPEQEQEEGEPEPEEERDSVMKITVMRFSIKEPFLR